MLSTVAHTLVPQPTMRLWHLVSQGGTGNTIQLSSALDWGGYLFVTLWALTVLLSVGLTTLSLIAILALYLLLQLSLGL